MDPTYFSKDVHFFDVFGGQKTGACGSWVAIQDSCVAKIEVTTITRFPQGTTFAKCLEVKLTLKIVLNLAALAASSCIF